MRRDHARPGRDAHPGLHRDLPFGSEQDVDARAELDQADAFAGGHVVAGLLVKDDAARDQSGDLLEYHGGSFPLHGDDVLLVLVGADFTAGHVEFTFLVLHCAMVPAMGVRLTWTSKTLRKMLMRVSCGALGL